MKTPSLLSGPTPGGLAVLALLLVASTGNVLTAATRVTIEGGRWHINGRPTNPGSPAEGLLMNVRMVNATFEDRNRPDFDPDANTHEFLAALPDYAAHGVNAFTLCLQGGMPGYEGAINSAFEPDGALRPEYLARVERVLRACDERGLVVILGCYYQRQSKILRDEAAVRAGVVNVARWIQDRRLTNVVLEIANEYPHRGFAPEVIRSPQGQASLIRLARETAPGLLVTASGSGDGRIHREAAEACDFLTPHWNGVRVEEIPARIEALQRYGKPIVCNEDDKVGEHAVAALRAAVAGGAGYGLMHKQLNQTFPFQFAGARDDPVYYAALHELTSPPDEAEHWPGAAWETVSPAEARLDEALLQQARDYALTGGGSGCIIRGGRLVLAWGDLQQRYDLKSTTKSIGATALGLAMLDGKISLTDKARQHHPALGVPPESNAAAGWLDEITILHLATHTAGFEKPGGYTRLTFRPGTHWAYSDGGPNWLAECITLAYQQDVDELLFERVFTPLGIKRTDLVWRNNSYRERTIHGIPRREFGSGVSANVDALARLGLLYLRDGRWQERQLLSPDFVRQARTTVPSVVGLPEVDPQNDGNASDHYGLLWWNNADGTLPDVPRDAYWSWGLYDSLMVVIPSLDLVAARAGQSWPRRPGADHYDVLKPFLTPLAAAARSRGAADRPSRIEPERPSPTSHTAQPPYPPSPIIAAIEWAPAATIVRRARGSDNWPITWGDDDRLYTAYGDGRGFEPFVPEKLSLGLARLTGGPDDFTAENLRAPALESRGDDVRGKKASGLLMVDGTLYLWARNARNAQLAWSTDHGAAWTWSDWRLTESFGCPTFLNFGPNYAGARDEFVYLYSHDHDSAYQPADRMVLARVPKDRLRERSAYEFFAGFDDAGRPIWSAEVARRAAVFTHPGRCYRSSVSYSPALGRYLWCQTLPGNDPRFAGGFGIYDAPEPWGPWTTVFFTEQWDVGPGETSSLPPKWMSADGLTVHLVFSGDDHFSVRRGLLRRSRSSPAQ